MKSRRAERAAVKLKRAALVEKTGNVAFERKLEEHLLPLTPPPQLDFGHWGASGCVAECVCEALDKFKRNLNHFVSWRRHAKSRHLPQRSPRFGERIDKSRQGLVVPRGTTNPGFMALPTFVGHQRHEGEQPQQRWGCSRNGQVGPLSLRFHAQVRSNLFEGDLELSTLHEVLQDLNWAEQQIRAE